MTQRGIAEGAWPKGHQDQRGRDKGAWPKGHRDNGAGPNGHQTKGAGAGHKRHFILAALLYFFSSQNDQIY